MKYPELVPDRSPAAAVCRSARPWPVRLAACMAAIAAMAAWSQSPELPELPAPAPGDLMVPAQEVFKDWPASEVLEKPYWHPWDARSFNRASLFGRPVLFVMAGPWNRRSQAMLTGPLSDAKVQSFVNEAYLSVLVNPDRRPDIRERYQTGTWPVIAFLLPNGQPMLSHVSDHQDAKPMTVGQVPVEPLLHLLWEGSDYYDQWAPELKAVAQIWLDRERDAEQAEPGKVDAQASDEMARWLTANANQQDGGFGVAPKFLLPGLEEYSLLRQSRYLPAIALHSRMTLEKLVASPLYDKKHGGMHRLSALPGWGDIQYEKMLETNSQLLRELVFALRHEDHPELRQALGETAAFIDSVLGRPGGGFFLAQWADPDSEDGGGYWRGDSDKAPPVDPLVLAGPNALAGAAMIRAGLLLDDPKLIESGRGALELVLERARVPGRGFDHVIEPGPEAHRFLTTQADVAFGMIDAYQTTGDRRFLEAGKEAVDFTLNNLQASESALFLDHVAGATRIGLMVNERFPVRPTVRLIRTMLRLSLLGHGIEYRERALAALEEIGGDLPGYQSHGATVALAVEEAIQDPLVIEIDGEPASDDALALRRAAVNSAWPWTVISSANTGETTVAVMSFKGKGARVVRPEEIQAAADRLVATLDSGGG